MIRAGWQRKDSVFRRVFTTAFIPDATEQQMESMDELQRTSTNILGGAVGNLLDRIFRGEVVDFLHFKIWRGYSWPDFNLADSFIVVGVGLLVLELLASEGEDRAAPAPDEPAR